MRACGGVCKCTRLRAKSHVRGGVQHRVCVCVCARVCAPATVVWYAVCVCTASVRACLTDTRGGGEGGRWGGGKSLGRGGVEGGGCSVARCCA